MRRRAFLGGVGAACAAALPAWATGSDGATVLTATDVHVSNYPTVEAVRFIGRTLERETGGRLRIRQYHSGQLGRESEAIDMARYGAIDITRVYGGALNNAFPLTIPLCLPYVFDSTQHMRHALDAGIAQTVLDGFRTRDLVGLAIYDCGARCFYNTRRPLVVPADLDGLKIRVAASDIFIRMVRMLGANPTPMSLGDTFSGMETRMIDGAENNMRSFHSSRHFEAASYWSQSEHSRAPDILLISQRSLDALQPHDRDLLVDAARESVKVMRELWDASEAEARRAVAEAGVQFNDVDGAAFRAAARPLVDEFLGDAAIADIYRRIRAAA